LAWDAAPARAAPGLAIVPRSGLLSRNEPAKPNVWHCTGWISAEFVSDFTCNEVQPSGPIRVATARIEVRVRSLAGSPPAVLHLNAVTEFTFLAQPRL